MDAEFASYAPSKIRPEIATEWIKNYFDLCRDNGEDEDKIIKSFAMDKIVFKSIFFNDAAVRVRAYLAKKTAGMPLVGDHTLIFVGVDKDGENILSTAEIWDNCSPCPQDCPTKGDFE